MTGMPRGLVPRNRAAGKRFQSLPSTHEGGRGDLDLGPAASWHQGTGVKASSRGDAGITSDSRNASAVYLSNTDLLGEIVLL